MVLEPKFMVFKEGEGFYYRLHSAGGGVILSGDGYKTKEECIKCIIMARDFAHVNGLYKSLELNGSYYFDLLSPWGETVGKSAAFDSPRLLERGIEAVKQNAPKAQIEDLG